MIDAIMHLLGFCQDAHTHPSLLMILFGGGLASLRVVGLKLSGRFHDRHR